METQCQQVHAIMREGGSVEGTDLESHVNGCPACAELIDGGPTFADALDASAEPPSAEAQLDGLWAEIDASIEEEQGPASWIHSRSTPARVAMVAGMVVAVIAFVLVAWARLDLSVYPLGRLALDLSVLTLPVLVILAIVMRPLHRSAWPRWVEFLALALAVGAVLVGPMLMPAHHDHPASMGGVGDALIPRAVLCISVGTLLGLPILVILGFVSRSRGPFGMPRGLAVVLAGSVGCLGVFLHCPLVEPQHLLFGHASVLAGFIALGLLVASLGRWPRRGG
ncbi:MAG: hypothetical protein AAF799_35955 [Myxococcota bacterium]